LQNGALNRSAQGGSNIRVKLELLGLESSAQPIDGDEANEYHQQLVVAALAGRVLAKVFGWP
jgi:hypothetical protein